MIKRRYICIVSALFALFTACEKPKVEIVEYDPSYALDKNVISVEMPTPSGYNPNNIFKVDGENKATMVANIVDGHGAMSTQEFSIVIRLRRALDKDLKLLVKEDKEKVKLYPTPGLLPFPEGAIPSQYEVTIPAGKTSSQVTLPIEDATGFVNRTGYLAAFTLSVADENAGVVASKKNANFFLRVNVSALVPGDNVSYYPRIAGSAVPSDEIEVWSNYRNEHAYKLFNGYTWNAEFWVQESAGHYIAVKFPKAKMKGAMFSCALGPKKKGFKALTVEVSDDGGTSWVPQGSINPSSPNWSVGFEFNTPLEINAMRFSGFESFSTDPNDRWVDLSEIYLVKE